MRWQTPFASSAPVKKTSPARDDVGLDAAIQVVELRSPSGQPSGR